MSEQETGRIENTANDSEFTPSHAARRIPAAPKSDTPVLTVEGPSHPHGRGSASLGSPSTIAPIAPAPASGKESEDDNKAKGTPDFERLAFNLARLMEQGGRAVAACFNPAQRGAKAGVSEELNDAYRSISAIAEHWLSDPARALEAQTSLAAKFLGLWANSLRRMSGETEKPLVPHDPSDKRFAAPEWKEIPYFDFLRQAHAIVTQWAEDLVRRSTDVDPRVRDKARFYLRQISSALSPSNFLATNPEL
ncbi:MAG: class I poly(R)-hydroxyalkanoic acid synthase, partial [Beijerinckiaceae bacterium]|nr:class I poly(R)-hydroxyalkanoic acid synthase [Beijerinckiaceae bacterium]